MRKTMVLMAIMAMLATAISGTNTTVPSHQNKTNFINTDQDTEHPESTNSSKLVVEGGLYIDEKFKKVENWAGVKKPELKLLSPMQRFPGGKKYAEDDDQKYIPYTKEDVNHFVGPCGNTQRGRVHFDSDIEGLANIEWEVKEEDPNGMCILKLADGPDDQEYDILWPLDKSAIKRGRNKGYFPCARQKAPIESKVIKFPPNVTCDACILQLVWKYMKGPKLMKQYYCADIEILGGSIEDCSGQCMNGGMCMNGACQCRKGFQGNFCQIKEYVPDSTSYTKYLKYFLFFIIMILAIVALMFGAYLLFKSSARIMESLRDRQQPVNDPDDLSGPGNPNQYKPSNKGQDRDLPGL